MALEDHVVDILIHNVSSYRISIFAPKVVDHFYGYAN